MFGPLEISAYNWIVKNEFYKPERKISVVSEHRKLLFLILKIYITDFSIHVFNNCDVCIYIFFTNMYIHFFFPSE